MKFLLDDEVVAELRWGQTCTVEISGGQHELVAKMDWVESEPLQFTGNSSSLMFEGALKAKEDFVRRGRRNPADVSYISLVELH